MTAVQCFQIDDRLKLAPLAPAGAAEASTRENGRVWIDLQDCERGELEEWLDSLRFTGLTRQLCLEARDRPGYYPLKNEIFVVIPSLIDAGDRREVEFVGIACRENLLLSMHRGQLVNRARQEKIQYADAWLADRSIAALLATMLINQSLFCLQCTADLKREVITLEERVNRDPDSIEADEIPDMRSRLMTLAMVVSDQLPSVQALGGVDKPFFKREAAQEHLNCAQVNLVAAQGALGRLDSEITDLRSRLQMHAQVKTNHRLAVLTVFSAIFMPLTLMAGIWGMNFEGMPELKWVFGYPLALGLMTLVGAGMFLVFRRKGWFD